MTVFSPYFPILISLSLSFFLSFVLPTMINLIKKNIHSFLGFAGDLHTSTGEYKLRLQCYHRKHPISSLAGGLGLIAATGDVNGPPNVVESTTLKPNTPPPPCPPSKRDPGGIGFIDDIGGGIQGLMSCTESLGFESSDERRVDDPTDRINGGNNDNDNGNDDNNIEDDGDDDEDDGGRELCRRRMMRAEGRGNWRKIGNYCYEKNRVRSFPPPLPSLNRNGQPSFFLRPVRKDGRLELTEVRIHRPEVLHASRHDGRLTLHLIPNDIEEEEEEEEEEILQEEEEQQQLEEEEKEELVEAAQLNEDIMEEEEEEEEIGDEKEEEMVGEWRYGVGTNEAFRRCHEMVNHHHHHVHGSHHHHLRMCGVSIV